jgi:hypothetical protein
MSLLSYLIIFALFIIFCASLLSLGDLLLKRCIRIELNQRGYKLIDLKNTEESFERQQPVPKSFRQYLEVEHGVKIGGIQSRNKRAPLYKEVLFCIPGGKTIRTLATAKIFIIFPYALQFKINLDDLQ